MPGIENLPSALVVVSYVVPEGRWIAITLAPATACCSLVTMPLIVPVVTPCALTRHAPHISKQTAIPATIAPRCFIMCSKDPTDRVDKTSEPTLEDTKASQQQDDSRTKL